MPTDLVETPQAVELPTGTWSIDPVHSVAGFAVRHMAVGTFRGEFDELDATLSDRKLVGRVKVASLQIKDEKLKGHLFSPDFFDAERFPEIVFQSTSLTVSDGALTSEGNLTIKDTTVPVTATGRIAGPAVTLGEVVKIGIDLETTVDRDAVGLAWNAPLPKGGFVLGRDVTITVTLELAQVEDDEE